MVIIFPVGRVDVVRRRHALAACKTLGIPSKRSTLAIFFQQPVAVQFSRGRF